MKRYERVDAPAQVTHAVEEQATPPSACGDRRPGWRVIPCGSTATSRPAGRFPAPRLGNGCDKNKAGQAAINGRTARTGEDVDPEKDRVLLEGQPVARESLVYLLLNKPRNVLCTNHDPDGRRTIHDILPPMGERVYHAGRLDRNSEGLLLVTNDGDLANLLTHPSHSFTKEYEVMLDRPLTDADHARVLEGVRSEGELLRAVSCKPSGTAGRLLRWNCRRAATGTSAACSRPWASPFAICAASASVRSPSPAWGPASGVTCGATRSSGSSGSARRDRARRSSP
ncbi:MAG: pseudouridine synthase [Kiritimatiellia bacterium]